MKHALFVTAASVALILSQAAAFAAPFEEANTSRWGADYKRFSIEHGVASDCSSACAADSVCRAWSYVKPGVEAAAAQCHLKDSVPQGNTDPCCISGIVAGAYDFVPVPRKAERPAAQGVTGAIATSPPADILQMPLDTETLLPKTAGAQGKAVPPVSH